MEQQKSLDQLMADLGYMFTKPGYYTYHQGWFSVFEDLCRNIDSMLGSDKRYFRWVEIKEKYGAARFYFEMDGLSDLILDLNVGGRHISIRKPRGMEDKLRGLVTQKIVEAQDSTAKKCIVCGDAAEVKLRDRLLVCLCDSHSNLTRSEINTTVLR